MTNCFHDDCGFKHRKKGCSITNTAVADQEIEYSLRILCTVQEENALLIDL